MSIARSGLAVLPGRARRLSRGSVVQHQARANPSCGQSPTNHAMVSEFAASWEAAITCPLSTSRTTLASFREHVRMSWQTVNPVQETLHRPYWEQALPPATRSRLALASTKRMRVPIRQARAFPLTASSASKALVTQPAPPTCSRWESASG